MLSVTWIFIGFVVGLLLVAVFSPPKRKDPRLPTPQDNSLFHTETGCVTFKTSEVDCTPEARSLNFVASQNK
jgi:hypothetical protein